LAQPERISLREADFRKLDRQYDEIVSIGHLSRHVGRVEQGGAEIIITRRSKPIARVVRIERRPRLSDA
jgi:prevent-host-death family protein